MRREERVTVQGPQRSNPQTECHTGGGGGVMRCAQRRSLSGAAANEWKEHGVRWMFDSVGGGGGRANANFEWVGSGSAPGAEWTGKFIHHYHGGAGGGAWNKESSAQQVCQIRVPQYFRARRHFSRCLLSPSWHDTLSLCPRSLHDRGPRVVPCVICGALVKPLIT